MVDTAEGIDAITRRTRESQNSPVVEDLIHESEGEPATLICSLWAIRAVGHEDEEESHVDG